MAGLGTPFISETVAVTNMVSAPTAGQTIVTLPHASLGAGYWALRIIGGAYGVITPTAPLANNLYLMRGSTTYAQLFNMPGFGQEEAIWYLTLGASDDISVQAIAAEGTGVVYNIGLRATRVA